LLDAAHIVMDADEQLGQPIVSNGLPMTKLRHAVVDSHLIGIDSDYRIHVSDRLLEIHYRPFLELGQKGIVGQVINYRGGVKIVALSRARARAASSLPDQRTSRLPEASQKASPKRMPGTAPTSAS
jgi:hypothetical protein